MTVETPVILSAVRTPIGKFQGGLSPFTAPELGGKAVAEAARRADLDPKQIDEAILGNVVAAGLGQNPARQAALKGGCDPRVAAMTINKVCGSGLKAVALAAQAVQLGESEIVVAGGMGNFRGAALVAILLGEVIAVGSIWFRPVEVQVFALFLVIAILVYRSRGKVAPTFSRPTISVMRGAAATRQG